MTTHKVGGGSGKQTYNEPQDFDDMVLHNMIGWRDRSDRMEIERNALRADLTHWQEVCYAHEVELQCLRAENARLRAALQWFIDNDDTNEGDTPLPKHGGRTWNEINEYWIDGLNRARAALAGEGGP